MLRDILSGTDPQVTAVLEQITQAAPDIIALQGIDHDLGNLAVRAFADALAARGHSLPHIFTAPPNAGLMTPLDLDGDGKTGGPGDAQGYGRFFGQGSMAILSRYPLLHEEAVDYATLLWRDLPQALLPEKDGSAFPSAAALAVQRLSSHGHWVVPVAHPALGTVTLMVYHATPPVFDGPEDRNGRRNHDETMLWYHLLDGRLGTVPASRFVILGDANLDPARGDGRGEGMRKLLARPDLQDPLPGQATVSFSQTGPLRTDYVLPSADWTVRNARIMPANPDASRHALVWVDLAR